MAVDIDAIDRFLAVAARHAERTAVAMDGEAISYCGIERLARRIAAAIAANACSAPRVLIALPPGPGAYAAMIAVGLAGGVYAPINLRGPLEKRRSICARFNPDVVVSNSADVHDLHEAAPDAFPLVADALPDLPPFEGRGTRHELAYVIHTSGSTGQPKGVEIPRAALDHYVSWIADDIGPLPEDRLSQYANIGFDLSVLEIYGALCFGASLHPPGGLGDRMLPARMIARERISIWISVPSVVSLMAQADDLTHENMASVRRFVFCGEPLLTEQVRSLFAACPDAVVQNTYGPTEATVSMTSLLLTRQDLPRLTRRAVPIGAPIAGMDLMLRGGPTADEGEIVLTGPQLARGYSGDVDGEAFRTIDTPSGPVRAYHTGDWARRVADEVHFEERIDFQIKHKGFRIELTEILNALAGIGHPIACVFIHDERLVALIEGRGDPVTVRRMLGSLLDSHAVPEIVRFMDSLPRGDTDKIDRRAAIAAFGSGNAPVDQGREIPDATNRVDIAIA